MGQSSGLAVRGLAVVAFGKLPKEIFTMTDLIRRSRYVVGGLYFCIAFAILVPVLLGYSWAVAHGQAGADWRVLPVAALTIWAVWFAYLVWPRQ